jgi:FAD:protein FMN transferase
MSGHANNRLDSWRTGLVVLVVALASGFVAAKWMNRDADGPELLNLARPAMGTVVEIQVAPPEGDDPHAVAATAMNTALLEVARIDSLFSRTLPPPTSMTSAEQLAQRRLLLQLGHAALLGSSGAFDPRMAKLIDAWGFQRENPEPPTAASISQLVAELHSGPGPTVTTDLEARPELLHFGAWAKGYAVDRAVAVLKSQGVSAGLVNAGGEVRGFGRQWSVGVQHPRLPGSLLARLQPGESAVATSGDYEQFFEHDGERYHHLLDPRTGYPARECQSVSILAESCVLADALATAVFVLGPEAGLELVESLPGVECLIVDATGERHDSSGLAAFLSSD